MKDLFISHSSKDKPEVKKFVTQLQDLGITVWFDENDLEPGDPLVGSIQEGIDQSSFLAIWITKEALNSGWVEKEWTSKYLEEVSHGIIKVIPCLAEDCHDLMPPFLKNKVCLNFYSDYENSIQKLLKKVTGKKIKKPSQKFTVKIKSFVNHLRKSEISIPLYEPIRIVTNLKRLPRSGKKLRFYEDNIPLPARSIYDHILSIAHSADCFWHTFEHLMSETEADDLARMLAYHDVCEVLLGDVPSFTHLNHDKRIIAQIIGENRYGKLPEDSGSPESIANDFIYMFLSSSARDSMLSMEQAMSNKDSPAYKMYLLLDKIDPIIAIWRYIHVFRKDIQLIEDDFFTSVEDFFTNPNVKKLASNYTEDKNFLSLVATLQDVEAASEYLNNDSFWSSLNSITFGFPADLVKNLIEGRRFEFPKEELDK